MTSKNNDQKNNDKNLSEETSSAPLAEKSTSQQDAAPKKEQPKVAEPPKTAEPAKVEFEEKQGKRGVKLGTVAIILSIIFGGGLAYKLHQQQADYQAQIAQLKSQLESTQASMKQELSRVQEETIEKATTVTHKAEVVLGQQQKSIESLQLAVADVKGRRPNDWLLAEADYLVKLAGRKLFLEHDVESATQLMESADQRIAALNDPSLVKLRKAMANDITKLRTIPLIDRDGLVLRLTALQQQVDKLPLANALLPEAEAVENTEVSEDIANWQDNLMTSLKDFSENFITFRTRDGNVIPLLSPEQHFYLKENIKAKLETAIKAVYQEQGEIYTTSLKTADKWALAFFNQGDNSVKEFNKTVNQLSQQNIQVEYPTKLQSQSQLSDVIRERLRREVTTMTGMEDK
ncbi:uroporphyrinogen-III C-methyltransferase [Vibrio diabolicus]|uniref:uroporphyrinogen-III C-methyltransferase n=1 Tax=Vibrio TaxID=662 RepID=UPI0012459AF1|nr:MULTISPECIES: uroporphyrinogen-III C-methyltransferase [Vibrio]KAB0321565.1 heme biosynthesis operon protein HemX [Vibrio diabolicus]MCG6222140.1 uroporphyrinogen-III C-methyltransferase [Vibrio diabolicus]MCG9232232.1 uroporphyrinogen-III C-methyltransferase [Vibrio diabolicus]MCG9574219.1 uroporphyrinogen-III C-methyltransferase [Vibrio diabolicus]MCG9591403.1 uroporphyrinogen-III C-methyltransferase [Vibrio diabolicus]